MLEPGDNTTPFPTVRSVDDIERLSADVEGVFIFELTDTKLGRICERLKDLRILESDGSNSVTDSGTIALRKLERLESLDLEWSAITDASLPILAEIRTLKYVDVGFCMGVTDEGVKLLKGLRPDLEVQWPGELSGLV